MLRAYDGAKRTHRISEDLQLLDSPRSAANSGTPDLRPRLRYCARNVSQGWQPTGLGIKYAKRSQREIGPFEVELTSSSVLSVACVVNIALKVQNEAKLRRARAQKPLRLPPAGVALHLGDYVRCLNRQVF